MKIKKFQKEKDKYKIYLDNNQIVETYEDIIIENNLLIKKEITEDQINIIKQKTEYSKIIHKLQKLIGTKYRSEKWVREYLKKIPYINKKEQEEIIENLKKNNFINDERYAKSYTNDKINLSLDGPYKVINDLAKENINKQNLVLELYTKDIINEKIVKIINKKNRENKKYMGYILEKRICDYLKQLGYSIEDINDNKHLITADTTIAQREFEKAYKKYQNKLTGEKLYQKIKQTLYTHGISLSEIEELIEQKKLEEN